MARATVTSRLVDEFNALHGLAYGDCGALYFADVFGSGIYSPKLYAHGPTGRGLSLSSLHDHNSRKRCANIRAAIAAASKG